MVMPCMTSYTKSVTQRKRVETIKASLLSKDLIKKRNESLITSSQDYSALQKPEKKNNGVTKTFTKFVNFQGYDSHYFR